MKIHSVFEADFTAYGAVLDGYNLAPLIKELEQTPCTDNEVIYVASHKGMEQTHVAQELESRYYGGMPIQIGYCNGQNTMLNCLEYHRDDEVNICATDILLLLAKQEDMQDFTVETDCVKAFFVPAGTAVIDDTFAVNVRGSILMTREFINHRGDNGRIINISSGFSTDT